MRPADRRVVHSERHYRNEGSAVPIADRSTDAGQELDQEYGEIQ